MAYTKPTKYTQQELDGFVIMDLEVDAHCARIDGLTEYEAECRQKISMLTNTYVNTYQQNPPTQDLTGIRV